MALETFLRPYLSHVKEILDEGRGQFMVVGMDHGVLSEIVRRLPGLTSYRVVETVSQKDLNPADKLFVIRLENNSSIEYQSLIYYYLELANTHRCTVCLVSTSSLALEFFEKRVRSRFENRILFVPYMNGDAGRFEICSSIEAKSQRSLMEKYQLRRYSTDLVLELFEPVHFVLLGIAFRQPLSAQKCTGQFKMAVIDTPELKRTPPSKILFGMMDLLDAGAINQSGQPLVDFNELKAFVSENCPLYLKKLINAQAKLRKH